MNIKSWFTPPEGPIDMEALTEKIQKTLERRQKTAFLAGFLASCESWNGVLRLVTKVALWGAFSRLASWLMGKILS